MTEYRPHELEWTPEKIERLWDFYGSRPAFDSLYFSAHSGAAIVGRIARMVELRGRRVLDFGAGRGDLLAHLVDRGVAAEGFEFSEDSAEVARRRLGHHPLFGGVTVSARLPAPFGEAAFDVVFLIEVVEHLLDEQLLPTLAEVARVLAPGGHVVVTTPHEEELEWETVHCPDCGATFHRWQHQRRWTVESLTAVAEDAGFETVLVEALDWRLSGRARLLARLRGRPVGRPHLLYVGRRAVSSIPLPP